MCASLRGGVRGRCASVAEGWGPGGAPAAGVVYRQRGGAFYVSLLSARAVSDPHRQAVFCGT